MAICDTCGNDYDKAFSVTFADGHSATFDSVECAAVQLAPDCAHCGCRILGGGGRGHLLLRPLRAQSIRRRHQRPLPGAGRGLRSTALVRLIAGPQAASSVSAKPRANPQPGVSLHES